MPINKPNYNKYHIQADSDKMFHIDLSVMDKIISRFENYLSKHSKALMLRLDISYPEGFTPLTNSVFQGFFENYIRYLQRLNYDPAYLWCTEIGWRNKRLHHHAIILLNANKIRWMPNIRKAQELWSLALGYGDAVHQGLVKRIKPYSSGKGNKYSYHSSIRKLDRLIETGCIIHRDDNLAKDEAIYWCSYLAKCSQSLPRGTRRFGCSMLK